MRETHWTLNSYGNLARVRRVELLPNGKWRIDYYSGLVELRDVRPAIFTK